MKSKTLKEIGNEDGKIIKKVGNNVEFLAKDLRELLYLSTEEKRKVGYSAFEATREYLRQKGVKEPENMPSNEMIYRTFGFGTELDKKTLDDWSKPIPGFPPTADDEKLPPAELIASLDGWADRQRIVGSVKAHLDIEKAREYASEHGRIFHEELIEFLEAQLAHWTHRTEDVPETYNPPAGQEPQCTVVHENRQRPKKWAEREAVTDSYNFEFHAALLQVSAQAFETAMGAEPYRSEIIGPPEHVKIYPYEGRDQIPKLEERRTKHGPPRQEPDTKPRPFTPNPAITQEMRDAFAAKMKAMDETYGRMTPTDMEKMVVNAMPPAAKAAYEKMDAHDKAEVLNALKKRSERTT
jgi:hypothetical protein